MRSAAGSARGGFVLVSVLGVLAVIALLTFAALFTTTLELLAARAQAQSAQLDAALEGALNLAAAELSLRAPHTSTPNPAGATLTLGPWPEPFAHVKVTAVLLTPQDSVGAPHLLLTASSEHHPARAPELLAISLPPAPKLLRRWRP